MVKLLGTLLLASFAFLFARDIIELQTTNFEVALANYKYLAVLFYDKTTEGAKLEQDWMDAANRLNNMHKDSQLAKV